MKGNQIVKKTKNDTLPTVRVGEETMAKYKDLHEKSGKTYSTIMRELIDNGKVVVIYNGKELTRDVAALHNKINQYGLKISNDIQTVREDMNQINLHMQSQGVDSEVVHMYLAKASLTLDDLQKQYSEQKNICNQSLRLRSSAHGNI